MPDRPREVEHPTALLSAFLDDELDEGLAAWVTRHLDRCPTCLEEMEALRDARSALRGLPEVVLPSALIDGVAAAARDASRARRRSQRRLLLGAASVSFVLLVLVGAFVAGAPTGDVSPPVERFVVDHVVKHGGGPMIVPVDLSDR